MVDFSVDAKVTTVVLDTHWSDAAMGKKMHSAMDESTGFVQTEVRKNVPVDQGIARGSILPDIRGSSVDMRGRVYSALEYIEVLEKGRSPNKPMPPKGVLLGWMARHSIDVKLEFIIRRAIGRKGTKAHKMFEQAAARGQQVVPGIFARHMK